MLTDEAGEPVQGVRNFIFRFYDAETAGSQLGGDVVTNGVLVSAGVFSVKLDASSVDFSRSVWLETAVADAGGDHPATLVPRTQLTAVPYAFHAFNGGGSGGGWSLTGNAGLVPGSNFIGTTDRTPLLFRANNLPGLALVPGGADGDKTPNVFFLSAGRVRWIYCATRFGSCGGSSNSGCHTDVVEAHRSGCLPRA